ncbi:glycosyltransferase [Lawsonibacter sp. OA9]|uniref:glycosyltransferase n=1 Tax=Oscillospiraceae TaxID=216572 RepID=UPI001F06398B|nr:MULTISPECIES: glycosyltransferase [Oscillospiraceae]MCH1978228.1 glycosyltransferase [Lawsonibacter sp. OA9]MCH1982638.1 glycosyltransferase [Ruminococcus sp. OA3]
MNESTICLMNDSFSPLIDGVANAVTNYAACYQKNFGKAYVAVPYHPDADDGNFPFPVIRYRSFDTTELLNYRAGYPFSVSAMKALKEADLSLIHSHCPFMSTVLARILRRCVDVPLVFTYHTKFDVDIAKTVSSKILQKQAVNLILDNINACDEVWTVSEGAGENLRSLGYKGDYIIMRNGVDFPRGRVSKESISKATEGADLPPNVPVYLFVGRMMWYKGLKIIFDSLCMLQDGGKDFRLIMIGEGNDKEEMERYTEEAGIGNKCNFTGAIYDREVLRAWYCRADLFLFPSSYDTNGLVVREAAACGLASVLIKGSCAGEGISDGKNGFLCEENAEGMYFLLKKIQENPEVTSRAGRCAMDMLYLSWEDSVAKAVERYEVIKEKYARKEYTGQKCFSDDMLSVTGNAMKRIETLRELQKSSKEKIAAMYEWQKMHLGNIVDYLWK